MAIEDTLREQEQVLFANEAFYLAFAGGDMDGMSAIWSEKEDIACIHPGWELLSGQEEVMESWRALLSNPPPVRVVSPSVFFRDEAAFVTCYEEIGGHYLLATNIFFKQDGQWRMAHHHAAPTRGTPPKPSAPDGGAVLN